MDRWQRLVLEGGLGESEDGRWSAFEVAEIVSRQNGKGAVLEVRELAGLFLFGEQLILHSAHEFKTASEAFRRVLSLVEGSDHLRKRVKKVRTSHGDEGIELMTGARLRFVARSRGSGRGFTGDCIILDEAYNLPAEAMAALLPTLSARPNPQVWYASSAGMATSEQLRMIRDRGRAGVSPSLAYFEWSAPDDADPKDPASWAQANPALGIRISEDFVRRELEAMPPAEFARERLGIWDDPDLLSVVVPADVWDLHEERDFTPHGERTLAVDVNPNRDHAVICSVSSENGRPLVRVTETDYGPDYRQGTDWVVPRLADLAARHEVNQVWMVGSAAAALTADLERAGLVVNLLSSTEYAKACGLFYDSAMEPRGAGLAHNGQSELGTALALARKAETEHGWTWGRKKSNGDIAPLVAATVALYAHLTTPPGDPSAYVI